jgi:AcrR family transcriptional regulator
MTNPIRKRRNVAPPRARLDRQTVLEAGLAILSEQGAAGLSMRRLAVRLGVQAMSLYNHVRDKRDLLDGIAGLVLARIPTPDQKLRWRERLEAIFVDLYETLAAHPWLVMMLAAEQAEPKDRTVLAGLETIVGILEEAGLSPPRQVSAFRGMLALCYGLVLTHTLGLSMSPSKAEAYWADWDPAELNPTLTPRLAKLGPQFLLTRPRDDLRFMLDAYLTALEKDRQ